MSPRCSPWLLGCCAALLCSVAVVVFACVWIKSSEDGECPAGSFRRAAVAADSERCSDIGSEGCGPSCVHLWNFPVKGPGSMLQQGGSAVDGAIAALLCTSVVNPQSMGIGGGSIFTIRNRTGGVKVYNSRETVPKSFQTNFLDGCSPDFNIYEGGAWIGVPGELRGYEAVHRAYGKLPWAKLFEPTIKLARGGIEVPEYLAKFLNISLVRRIGAQLCSAQLLCKGRTFLSKGDVLKFPKLADTLEAVAKNGADAFYTDKIGLDLVKDVRAAEFSLSPDSLHGNRKIHLYQHYVETLKFVNGQKREIRDLLKNQGRSPNHLMDSSFIKQIKTMICSNCTHDVAYYNVTPSSDQTGTTHVSVLGEDGLAVSVTSTINQAFGGGNFSPNTGVILNNELADFCGRAETVSPGEQPPSSMTPVILESESGDLLVIGGSGGSMIPTAVASSIINHLWLGMSLKDAIAAPIVFVDSKNHVNFEPGFDKAVSDGLMAFGHKRGQSKYFFNVVSAVKKEKGCISAVSDGRKMGVASGF